MYVARMPILYALRDAFGAKDVIEDTKATLRGEGMDYRDFEPSEGYMHQGVGRERRIRAGLRYSQGGKRKYWLPQPASGTNPPGNSERRFNQAIAGVTGRSGQSDDVYAPLLRDQAEDVVHIAPDLQSRDDPDANIFSFTAPADDSYDLPFGDIDADDEELFQHSKKYLFGDYNYPCVDVSNEFARIQVYDEEERILRDERGAYFSSILGPNNPRRAFGKAREGGYGAVGHFQRSAIRDLTHEDEGVSSGKQGHSQMSEAVIDKEHDRTPEMSGTGIRLGWTNSQGLTPAQIPRIRTLSNQRVSPEASSSGSSPSTSSPRDRPLPSPRADPQRPVLPPDAVDLIVEDTRADEDKPRERRKGETPARHPQKVYRRGYVVEHDGQRAEGEVDVIDRTSSISSSRPEADANAILEAEDEAVDEATVARVETPPAHAQIHVGMASDDNPWA